MSLQTLTIFSCAQTLEAVAPNECEKPWWRPFSVFAAHTQSLQQRRSCSGEWIQVKSAPEKESSALYLELTATMLVTVSTVVLKCVYFPFLLNVTPLHFHLRIIIFLNGSNLHISICVWVTGDVSEGPTKFELYLIIKYVTFKSLCNTVMLLIPAI